VYPAYSPAVLPSGMLIRSPLLPVTMLTAGSAA
jgi:hypothetical protein